MEALMTSTDKFMCLMRRHQSDVWRYLRVLGCDVALADDLTQEVFIQVYRKPVLEISDAASAAYLRKAARNTFLNYMKRERRTLPFDPALVDQVWQQLTPEDGDARLTRLSDCVEKLSERARRAVALRYRQDLPEAEVGRAMDVTEDAAKALLKRARQQLRECIERDGGTDD